MASQKDYDEANNLAGALDVDETKETMIYEKTILLQTEPEPIQSQSQESVPIPDDPNIIKLLETDLTLLRQENEGCGGVDDGT